MCKMRRFLFRWLNRYVHVIFTGGVLTLVLYVFLIHRVAFDPAHQHSRHQDLYVLEQFSVEHSEMMNHLRNVSVVHHRPVPQTTEVVTTVKSEAGSTGSNSSCLLAGVPRPNSVHLTIGIPTLKRPKGEYFFNTLASLFNQSSPSQQQDLTLVAMLADRSPAFNDAILTRIKVKYPQQLRDGLLLVISAPNTEHLFKNNNIKRTYNDSLERVRWRSKQNLDYAALMELSANLSTYYLQIEDDVTAAPNYIQHIQDFIRANRNKAWAGLEVCPHGFIGKLFRSTDLPKLVTLLRTFYLEMPCDFLINHFYHLMLQPKVIRRKGTLFFHQGKYSSLTNVIRKTDKILPSKSIQQEVLKKSRGHNNPQADLYTSMAVYRSYHIGHAYRLDSKLFFWGKDVKDGDYVTIVFQRQQRLDKIIMESGLTTKAGITRDFVRNATVEVGERAYIGSRDSKALCTDTHEVGEFKNGRFEKSFTDNIDVKCVTIVITHAQIEWVVIREIVVFVK